MSVMDWRINKKQRTFVVAVRPSNARRDWEMVCMQNWSRASNGFLYIALTLNWQSVDTFPVAINLTPWFLSTACVLILAACMSFQSCRKTGVPDLWFRRYVVSVAWCSFERRVWPKTWNMCVAERPRIDRLTSTVSMNYFNPHQVDSVRSHTEAYAVPYKRCHRYRSRFISFVLQPCQPVPCQRLQGDVTLLVQMASRVVCVRVFGLRYSDYVFVSI